MYPFYDHVIIHNEIKTKTCPTDQRGKKFQVSKNVTGGSAVLSSNSSHTSDEGFASISDALDDRNIHIFISSVGTSCHAQNRL